MIRCVCKHFLLGCVVVCGLVHIASAQSFLDKPTTQETLIGASEEMLNVPGDQEQGSDDSILDSVKRIINYVLGLLALIVLILFIWGGLQVIFGATSEDAHKKAVTIIRNAALGLAIVAFAWLLVSFIFVVLERVTQPATPGATLVPTTSDLPVATPIDNGGAVGTNTSIDLFDDGG